MKNEKDTEDIGAELQRKMEKRVFCTLLREGCEKEPLYGFIVEVVVVHEIRDFQNFGYIAVRVADVSRVKRSKIDRFQQKLLAEEGKPERELIGLKPACASLKDLIDWLPLGEILCLEDEQEEDPRFFIGVTKRTDKEEFVGRYFSGAGKWDKDDWRYNYLCAVSNSLCFRLPASL